MSGRSGYGRSKIVGKLINLPANMMMAGLAPKVGKPGWAIRLYYQRVDECFCCPPIKIIRRFFSPGDVTDQQLGGFGITTSANLLPGGGPNTHQMYYGIVFDRTIKSPQATTPSASAAIKLQTPTGVNWSTGSGGGGTATLDIDLTNTDFQILSTSGLLGGLNTGLIIDVGNGVVGTGVGLAQWAEVNTPAAPLTIQNVELQSTAGGAFTGDMAYIITNHSKVGGCCLLFNVTRLFLSSSSGPITSSAPAETNSFTAGQVGGYGLDLFRQNLAIAAGFTATTVADPTNNISTTYTPTTSTVTFTSEDCPPENGGGGTTFNAPIGGFAIAARNGQPILELLP